MKLSTSIDVTLSLVAPGYIINLKWYGHFYTINVTVQRSIGGA